MLGLKSELVDFSDAGVENDLSAVDAEAFQMFGTLIALSCEGSEASGLEEGRSSRVCR